MHENTRSHQAVAEGPDSPEPWDTCFNVTTVCPGCLTTIRPCASGIHSCNCQDALWRRHPMATGPDAPWQVNFLDYLAVC